MCLFARRVTDYQIIKQYQYSVSLRIINKIYHSTVYGTDFLHFSTEPFKSSHHFVSCNYIMVTQNIVC